MTDTPWRPHCNPDRLRARADLLHAIRTFFAGREVLEVETPLLSRAAGTDPQLFPLTADYQPHPGGPIQTLYLQTSPEFAMKRLLADGAGAIFQISKAFRNGERGPKHNPEFTMLEWYRPGFDDQALMDEVESLVQTVYPATNWRRLSYADLFEQYLGINPHRVSVQTLEQLAQTNINTDLTDTNKDTWLDLLFSHLIEPQLVDPVFVYDYPASQAALAEVVENAQGYAVARRFELVIRGMEIANGYKELTDATEQRRRFVQQNAMLRSGGLQERPLDENLLAALAHGLPACAGVALGVDRLLMLVCGAAAIDEVLAFPLERS